jgi:REP element-mobilizing transposase RayT
MPDLPFRKRLWHDVPHWVEDGAWFFITMNCATRGSEQLTLPGVSEGLMDALRFNHDRRVWHVGLALLMPDHWHGILSFPRGGKPMAELFRDWKRFTAKKLGVSWQDGFFDHRLRSEEEVAAKWHYIRRNPVVKGLCATVDDWPQQMRSTHDGGLILG